MRVRSPLVALVVLVAWLAAACGGRSRTPALFELRSPGASGIRFANTITEDDSVYNVLDFDYLYNGAGVAVADFDGDGRSDLFFGGNMVSSRLYLNRGDLRFDDVTRVAGVETAKWITGVTVVDIDGNARPDLYLSVAGPDSANRGNLLFVNLGAGADGIPRFAERARDYGIADVGYNTHAAFFDYDRDGDLDLYVLKNALEAYNRNITRPRKLNGEAPSTDRLYRNDGKGHFTDVSREAGILQEGYGLGLAITDLNRDGWPDVYVANDFLTNDLVWINRGDGTFTNEAARYLKHQSFNAMGVDIADYNNDALADVVVVDMLPSDNFRRKLMYPGGNYDRFHQGLDLGYQPSYVRNTLQLNNGPGPDGAPTFSEIGQLAGIDATDWSWAPLLADLDNDGRKDLFVSNGYRQDVTNLDYVAYLQTASQFGAERDRRARLLEGLRNLPDVKVSNYAFRNEGDLTFSNRTKEWGLDEATYANGAAYADLDGDGDLDLVVNNIDGPASLYVNHAERIAGRHWLRVALTGPAGNSAGLGATVSLYAGGTRQYLEQHPVRGYVSSVDPVLHFGLGVAARADSIEVRWPDGACQRLGPVGADRLLKLDRRDAGTCAPAPPAADERFFHRARTDALPFVHVAREFPDFKVTPLLPHKLSEGGPGIAVGDVDGDGRDDVYLGADRGQPKGLWLQTTAGHFVRREIPGAERREDMGALLFDADGDGDLDLVVTSGGGFIANDSATYLAQLYVNDGRGGFTPAPGALAGASTSASSVVAADYDADGDLDLFVGGRAIPGKYPLPARSYLLRNDTPARGAPRFTDVTAASAPSLANAGLVTSALFTDFDADGRVDLLVAGEWMPLTFLRNAGGRFDDVTSSTGLGDTHGWWNSLVAGDFDRDGDVDYVAGNLGLNTRYRATERKPVRVHAADFDGNGSIDPVLSSYVGDESYPVASRDLLVDQMISMKGRFPRYEDYARATLDRTLSAAERGHAYVGRSVTFASVYLENRGGGKFVRRALPTLAQIAPVYGMLATDANGDGALDVLLAGNSHGPETQAGWDDASIGAVLLGDGRGGFTHVSGSASGFFVPGNARAVADVLIDDEHSLVLVTQNGDSLRTFVPARQSGARAVRVQPLDSYAVLTDAQGRTSRVELPYGSTYLSQSSRYLRIGRQIVDVKVFDSRGASRSLRVDPQLARATR